MLDKKHVKTWVKVVAWGLAIVFGASFSFLFMLPRNSMPGNTMNSPTSNSTLPTITTTAEEQARSILGQAKMAMDSEDYEQAINFFQQAREMDPNNEESVSGLAEAYYEQGKAFQTKDPTAAVEAFNGYLETLPNGTKAQEVKELLTEVGSADETETGVQE